jgi:hypothetical protein
MAPSCRAPVFWSREMLREGKAVCFLDPGQYVTGLNGQHYKAETQCGRKHQPRQKQGQAWGIKWLRLIIL